MVFALHSKVVQNLAAIVEFVHSIIKTLNCHGGSEQELWLVEESGGFGKLESNCFKGCEDIV